MIVADENIDQKIINSWREININVYSIYESNRGITDEQIIELSKTPPRIILTEDKDFGEWVFAHHQKNISIIFLRYHFTDTMQIIDILCDILSNRKYELFGRFTTITIHKIRSREIKE